jgi:light-regulated signal transduction histidine kinase (bacteriophytochrome)
VDDLLNLARVGRQEIKRQRISLEALVNEVIKELGEETGQRKIEWQVKTLPFVDCDAGLIKQVFANLIANAVKYTRPRPVAHIELGSFEERGELVIYVRDNGVGFNMKHAHKLFGIFQRLHRAEDFEGTGVGLATVERIIRKHQGRIWAQAEPDKGATFFFTLEPAHETEHIKKV